MIISKEIFKKAIESVKEIDKCIDDLNNLNINMIDSPIYDKSGILFDLLVKICFTESGADIIYWYLYDKEHETVDFDTLWEKIKDMRV